MSRLSLLDVAKLNSGDAVVGLIEEVATYAPEARTVAARSITGTSYKTLHRTGLPTTGFRNANQGTTASKSTYENRLVECFILSGRVEVDRAVADAYMDGREALQALEALGVMQSAMIKLGSQFYYGDVDVSGFPGLQSLVDSSMVSDAGGTTADTGSSVYFVKYGEQDVQFVLGRNGSFELGEFRLETISDASGNPLDGYVSELTAWVGLQAVNKYCVSRIKDLTADSGKGLTDDLIYEHLTKWPVGKRPSAAFMNRRSLEQLRKSRTATNVTGAPAPIPTVLDSDIPIIVTDSILNTEALS